MERVVTGARHVEVQLIADSHGTAWAVGTRDCSMQRRNQKVIEESACPVLTPHQDRELRAAAVRLAKAAGYVNAGTVEFLYQPEERRFAFLEVNTRLQVEHPVTELTTGLDLVKLQLHVAAGGRLEGEPPPTEGYAIEARLNAEDPQRAFAPAPGTIEILTLPVGPGIRVDTGVAEGDVIPPEYDSMIAKVIAHGRDRGEALARLHRALSQLTVVVRGGTTNRSFLLDLLDRPEVRASEIDTSWLDRLTMGHGHLPTRLADVALDRRRARCRRAALVGRGRHFLSWSQRGRPQADTTIGRTIELRHGGQAYRPFLRQLGPDRGVRRARRGRGRRRRRAARAGAQPADDRRPHVRRRVVGAGQRAPHRGRRRGPPVLPRRRRRRAGARRRRSSSPSTSTPGDVVKAGERLGVVEAMKMEIGIPAPLAGRVRDVFVTRNVQVDAGTPLFRIEPAVADDDEHVRGARRAAHARLGAQRRPRPCSRRSCSATTSTWPAPVPRWRRSRRTPTRPARWRSSTPSPTSPRSPRSAVTRAPTTSGRLASTSTPTCARSTSSARACRRGSATSWPAPSPTTPPTPIRARGWRASSSPSSAARRSSPS